MGWTVIVSVGDCIMLLSHGKYCMFKKKFWGEKRWGQIYSIGIFLYVSACLGLSLYCFPGSLGMVNIFWCISFIECDATFSVSGMCRYCCFVYSLPLYVMHFSYNVAAVLTDIHSVTSLSNIHACCPCITRAAVVNCPTVWVMRTYQHIKVWLHVFSFNPPYYHDPLPFDSTTLYIPTHTLTTLTSCNTYIILGLVFLAHSAWRRTKTQEWSYSVINPSEMPSKYIVFVILLSTRELNGRK